MAEFPYRPFKSGEKIKDYVEPGTFSSELSRTVQINGEWANVPSLWMGPDKPIDLRPFGDDQLANFVSLYEDATGKRFKRWSSLDKAQAAASKRSDAGGASAPGSRYVNDRRRMPTRTLAEGEK